MAFGLELPDDVTADILRRLPPRSVAVSRCVSRGWRDLVDAHRLLRADLLPLSVGGIFMHYSGYYSPAFLARPTTARRRPSISGDLDFVPDGFSKILDHCNGLLLCCCLCTDASDLRDNFANPATWRRWELHDYVANPATRRWAWLPRRPRPTLVLPSRMKNKAFHQGQDQIKCLVYDPTVSPHYEVFYIHPLRQDQHQRKSSSYRPEMLAFVYSSVTGRWEERLFLPQAQGEAGRVVEEAIADTRSFADNKVYWRGALYVPNQNGFFLRISIPNANYRLIPMPARGEFRSYEYLMLGRSEKGVYCASGYDWHGLRIFLLNESCGEQAEWELKHNVDFRTFSPTLGALLNGTHSDQQNEPWVLQDINCHRYHQEVVEDEFEWDSDDDDVVSTEDTAGGQYAPCMFAIGFHPYKEIVYLDTELRRGVAYHWNTSKFQDLGNIFPKDYDEIGGRFAEIETSFIYTPCWMDGGFPEEEKTVSAN